MTNTSKPDHAAGPDTVTVWNSFQSVAKFWLAFAVAIVTAGLTAVSDPVTPSKIVGALAVCLLAALTYLGRYNEKWYLSAKVWLTTGAAVLTWAGPYVTQYLDTGEWHNLSGGQWMTVVLGAMAALGVGVIPNSSTVIDVKTGEQVGGPAQKLIEARENYLANVAPVEPADTSVDVELKRGAASIENAPLI